MLKQTVVYTDFDGEEQTETLYFNLSRTRLLSNLDLKDQVQATATLFEGEERELTSDEVRQVLDLVKRMMELSYGVRSEDGKRFDQNPQHWVDFQQTAVYEAFLWSLFENPALANNFIMSVLPEKLLEAAKEEAKKQGVEINLPS